MYKQFYKNTKNDLQLKIQIQIQINSFENEIGLKMQTISTLHVT